MKLLFNQEKWVWGEEQEHIYVECVFKFCICVISRREDRTGLPHTVRDFYRE